VDKLISHAERAPKPLTRIRSDVPAELARVLDKMMAKSPKDRYQTPAAVAEALAPFLSEPDQRRPRRRLVATLAAAVAGLLLLGGVIYVATDNGQLVIDSKVDDVQVVVSKGGEQVEVIDLKSGTTVKRLPSGDYQVSLKGDRADVKLNKRGFTISRWGETVVTVREEPALAGGKTRRLKGFAATDPTITRDGVKSEQGGWRIDASEPRTVRLFELPKPAVEDGIITYRAKIKSEKLQGKAYLEMWCRVPGLGEFFSKGLQNPIQGTTDWSSYEIPFFLKKGQTPDLLKLNVNMEGKGTVWIKDVEVHFTSSVKDKSVDQERQSKFDAGSKAAEAWLKLVDQGKYAESWEQSSKANREGITKQEMVKIYQDLFGKFGKLVSRRLSHPFTPDGEHVLVYFKTVYKNLEVLETVTTVQEKDGQWRVEGYQYAAQSSEAVIEAALRAADAWLKLKDQEKYDQCWEQSSAFSKKSVSKEDVVKLQKELLKKMGKVQSRARVTRQFETALPGAPAGEYVFIEYQAKYSILKDTVETVIPMLDKDGQWRVASYHYAPGKHEFAEFADKQAPGKERRIKAFGPKDKPLDHVVADEGGWRIDLKKDTTVHLFEIADPGVEQCTLLYRLKIKTKLKGEVYQVMWCRLPKLGGFFSKGLDKKVSGNTDWTTVAIPFFLEKGQRPDLLKLDLVATGSGTIWIKDVEVVRVPKTP
jgi:hypothetical protein